MIKPTYVIFVETIDGEIIEAFTWCRDEDSGIAKAREAMQNAGFTAVRVWAEPVKQVEGA